LKNVYADPVTMMLEVVLYQKC